MFNRQVLYDGSTDMGHYKVVETAYNGRRARLLYGGHNTPQSGLALDDNDELLFDYNQRFLEIAQSLAPRRVLVIGGGAFTLPKALLEHFRDTAVDVVELDPLLPELAFRYFGLEADPRLRIFVDEGRHFIDDMTESYDLIIVDAFSEFTIPRQLYTAGAVERYGQLLTQHGVLAMNFIAPYKGMKKTLAHELVATFCTGFKAVSLYPADHTYVTKYDQNLLLVASHDETSNLDYLHSQTVALDFLPDDAVVTD
jgi:spermidine synthase